MTKEQFTSEIMRVEKSLYYVAKSICKRDEDCADAIQNAILKAYDKRETLRQEKYFKTWLTRILINECYQILRDMEKESLFEEVEVIQPDTDTSEQGKIYELIEELEEIYRVPFVLFYVEGYSVKEVAELLGLSTGNIKVRLNRARKKLKAQIQCKECMKTGA